MTVTPSVGTLARVEPYVKEEVSNSKQSKQQKLGDFEVIFSTLTGKAKMHQN